MELIGKKIGKLFVVEKTNEKASNGEYKYKCICECGKEKNIRGSNLKNGNSKSCGCYNVIKRSKVSKGYRQNNLRLYNIYQNMKERCYNKNFKEYKHYGGRNIKICEEWQSDYRKFYEWSMNNGYNNNLTIDRINVDGDYEPKNCRWITRQEQAYNKRNSKYITYKGETKTLAEWSKELNMSQPKLRYRIMNWDIEQAFNK